ncbi:M12 family metallopeptidase [Bacillus sp. EB600]|uniref:M12 family metallopeptidase n=1 Tax=Bacillus sp. EB600 TaxID=2806345 RepID=UPI002109E91B|nr:M12 family metallopeptidase [Bacillus sp. EB600]MCQ6282370.1 hypothetical protein [Bacillus sp. EB600]
MKVKSSELCENHLISEEIRTVLINLPSGPRQVKYSVINGLAIFEGDIILGSVEEMENSMRNDGIRLTGEQFLWPDGIIPYKIDLSLTNKGRVTDAISHWEHRTFIRFVAQTIETNYVTFRPGEDCSSFTGMRRGEQL